MPPHPEVRLRPARARDLDALVCLEETSFAGDRLTRRSLRRFLASPRAPVLVAEGPGGTVLGSAVVLRRRGSGVERLYSLAVAPEARGSGVGGALLDHLLARAVLRGTRAVRLEVREDNGAAIGLYRSRGFHETGRTPGYYADGAAAVRMERPLEGRQ